jgi:hypothetical protein
MNCMSSDSCQHYEGMNFLTQSSNIFLSFVDLARLHYKAEDPPRRNIKNRVVIINHDDDIPCFEEVIANLPRTGGKKQSNRNQSNL